MRDFKTKVDQVEFQQMQHFLLNLERGSWHIRLIAVVTEWSLRGDIRPDTPRS